MHDRILSWDGCVNVRDLGGHPTEGGGTTQFGSIVRADNVRRLSDAGWAALVDYGVRTIVDLRLHSELEADPPRELPVDVVHIPLVAELDSEHWREIDAITNGPLDSVAERRAVYLEFLERFRDNFPLAVRAIARAPVGGVLVHCEGGKDRTGLVAALLLRLAGTSADDVAADYAESGPNLAREIEEWVAGAETSEEQRRRKRIGATPREAMLEVLAELERRYGSVADYLRAGGATDAELESVRARLTGR